MAKKLFLLDGMALVYRAHFAFMSRPILTSKGVNTSALYGFTQTVLDILKNQQPTHLAVAFDTAAPTQRHIDYPEYKATREEMPEDLSLALPHVRRMLDAFRIPVLTCDGYEADDIIGTLARVAEKQGYQSFMVTPDKDFGQLIDANTFLYKPSRMGDGVEILGVPEILKRWNIRRPEQVIDVLALMGDTSDNVPGVPGIGEKTAMKLIGQFESVENLLAHTEELSGRLKENLQTHRELALLSKRLVTINCQAPCPVDLDSLKLRPPDEPAVQALLVEFEFNSIGRRLFGEDFKAGRGAGERSSTPPGKPAESKGPAAPEESSAESSAPAESAPALPPGQAGMDLKTLSDVPHNYRIAASDAERKTLLAALRAQSSFGLSVAATSHDPKAAKLLGLAFSLAPHEAYYVALSEAAILREFAEVLESAGHEKVGHDLKFALNALHWNGVSVAGKLFDTMVAHSLVEPDLRHSLEYLGESLLGYTLSPAPPGILEGRQEQLGIPDAAAQKTGEWAMERADLALQLRSHLEPLLIEKSQQRVFYEIESPLIPALAEMEYHGIKADAGALNDFGAQLAKELAQLEKTICHLAGTTFNLNSPKQLGQILFDVMKICEAPKTTKSGQYATDEQTLTALAPEHEIVQRLLEYRVASKLKSTYADTLPTTIWPRTGRIHTTFNQVMTSTGRLNSQDPNLQNIPIRTERGQEIRKAFVPGSEDYLLLSADYSQIELRIIAAISHEPALSEAFRTGADVHTATAARVYDVFPEMVTPEMRRKAKMVNYGIAYGISAFGLAQRLSIPRKEAANIIEQYFKQFPGIRKYMDDTITFAREHGYVETVTGRRRYLRDIRSSNHTVRSGAERNAINAPIQGTAADLIKIAMIHIHEELRRRKLQTRMLLQVHDELVFDLFKPEEGEVRSLVEEKMTRAIPMEVPLVVEMGTGRNWLEAH